MRQLISLQRYATFVFVGLMAIFTFIAGFWAPWVFILFIVFAALTILGIRDMNQTSHAIVRNYPVLGHIRFLFEKIRPEIRQYLIEGDQEERDCRGVRLRERGREA